MHLDRLMAVARRTRDAGLFDEGRPGVVTYSKKVFIPLTRLCRDRCHYCTFVSTPTQLAKRGQEPFMAADEILAITREGSALGCKEALFTLNGRPEDRWPEARAWLEEAGYASSTLEHLRAMSILALEETGLLPHLNPGVISWAEMARMKPVAPSIGMMLETTSRRLFEAKGKAHHKSPDKDPVVRLPVLEDAGRLNVPFTTGLLIGIGVDLEERADSILELRRISRAYGPGRDRGGISTARGWIRAWCITSKPCAGLTGSRTRMPRRPVCRGRSLTADSTSPPAAPTCGGHRGADE
jgi:FO synthase